MGYKKDRNLKYVYMKKINTRKNNRQMRKKADRRNM